MSGERSQEREARSQKAAVELVLCPWCGSLRSRVVSIWRAGRLIRRRRECLECGRRFNTNQPSEVLDTGAFKVAIATHGNKINCHVKVA